jgi:hypothetical protein
MEKIMWTDRVKNDEVLHIFKEDSNILYISKERKSNGLVIIWWKLPSKAHYLRKDGRNYGRDGRKRKKN